MTLNDRLLLLAEIVANNDSVWTLDISKWSKRMWKKYGNRLSTIYDVDLIE